MKFLRVLRNLGADMNWPDRRGRNALMFACMCRRSKLAVLLINQYHVNLSAKDGNGNTALMYAATVEIQK